MRILIVDDEAAVGKVLKLTLEANGFMTYVAGSGEEALDLAQHYAFDLIVLDINLPDMDGIQVLRRLRAGRVQTPVLALSGDDGDERINRAFSSGADDFLAKPFRSPELVARIRAIVRRSCGFASSQLNLGDVVVNLDARKVLVRGQDIHFTPREYQIMELLALRRGRTVTREVLLDHIYGGLEEPGSKILDVYICKIRQKMQAAGIDAAVLATEWGRGYRIDPQLCDEAAAQVAATA